MGRRERGRVFGGARCCRIARRAGEAPRTTCGTCLPRLGARRTAGMLSQGKLPPLPALRMATLRLRLSLRPRLQWMARQRLQWERTFRPTWLLPWMAPPIVQPHFWACPPSPGSNSNPPSMRRVGPTMPFLPPRCSPVTRSVPPPAGHVRGAGRRDSAPCARVLRVPGHGPQLARAQPPAAHGFHQRPMNEARCTG